MRCKVLRIEIAAAERLLYDASTPERDRSELSMKLSILRRDFCRAAEIGLWTVSGALKDAERDEQEENRRA